MAKRYRYRHGLLARLRDVNTYQLWLELRHSAQFMRYFPDCCLQKVPDREYFWRVLGVVMPHEYRSFMEEKVVKVRKQRCFRVKRVMLTREADEVFQSFDFDNQLALLS
jgi:hypothetical protein